MTDRERIDAILSGVVDNLVTNMCCSSCSSAAAPKGTYAFYHSQDIERAFSRTPGGRPVGDDFGYDESAELDDYRFEEAVHLIGDLYIGFGIQDGPDDMPRLDREYDAVGRRIDAALHAGGFGTEWNGSADQKVRITSVSTTRRLT